MQTMIGSIEKRIMVQHRSSEASQRLETIPGIGVIGATAIKETLRLIEADIRALPDDSIRVD